MKLKFLLFISLWFCLKLCLGQNYIPNYSFEDTATRVTPLYLPTHWTAATNEGWNYMTPYNNLTQQHLKYSAPSNFPGYQVARTGIAYGGVLIYHLYTEVSNPRREYMQVELDRSLKFDSTYCLQLFVSLADSVRYASRGQLGVYFSNNAIGSNGLTRLPYTPQIVVSPNQYITDKFNWVEFNFQYKAQGGEKYITIGNFNDTTAIDTMFVGGGDSSNVDYLNTYYYIDDVWLSHCDSLPDSLTSLKERSLKQALSVYPNPFVNDIVVESKESQKLTFMLYNSLGQAVTLKVQKQDKKYKISTPQLSKGLYWLRVSDGKREEVFKLIRD